jgi:hypothetical protein
MPPNLPNQPYDVLPAPKVFISYARDDMNRALGLGQALRAHGVNVWRDQDSIYGGQQWPKVIGEAIADCDAVLLLWSANSAASHFVEFEWTTALALKKTFIPCLLDETKLPPALAAINGIACRNADEATPKILAALPREPQPREAERRAQVIAQLQQVTATEPAAALAQARALFTQSNISVGGHFIQGVQVTINEGRQSSPTFAIAFAVIALIAVAALAFFVMRSEDQVIKIPAPSPTPNPTPMSVLRGAVVDQNDRPIVDAEVNVEELPDRPPVKTDSYGSYSIENIPVPVGDQVKIIVRKDGYETLFGQEVYKERMRLGDKVPQIKLRRKKR